MTDKKNDPRVKIYTPDDFLNAMSTAPEAVEVPFGTDTKGQYYDGYPQIVKCDASEPEYEYQVIKDVMVPMRDGIHIAIDVYRPAASGAFPVILCWGEWGKDCQDIVEWMGKVSQKYFVTPFWDGSMEGCDYTYTVPRGYIHVIAEPRGIGNSEGLNIGDASLHDRRDIYDAVEWIAAQSWCNGKVAMMGPSSYSRAQLQAGQEPAPHLVCIRPDEAPEPFAGENFTGIYDPLLYNVHTGVHANDHLPPVSYHHPEAFAKPRWMDMPKEEFEKKYQELLEDPDVKYNMKLYAEVRYPQRPASIVDDLLYFKHPTPVDSGFEQISLPFYIGCCWNNRLYEWGTFEAFDRAQTPDENKKLIVYPPMFPSRPYVWYHDEAVRWFDYWMKGKDNGIMSEPRIKLFVMGINKWRFADNWPLPETKWTKYYLNAGGALTLSKPVDTTQTETFVQPAPYLDPTVYCLSWQTEAFEKDTEVIGNIGIHFDAEIDIDDTNWMADVLDVAPDGTRRMLSSGALKAKCRALDEEKSTEYKPIHLRQEHVPIVPGEVNRYDIALTPTGNMFLAGHKLEVIIRNQEDLNSKMALNGVKFMPFMQSVTHTIHFGNSYIVIPVTSA